LLILGIPYHLNNTTYYASHRDLAYKEKPRLLSGVQTYLRLIDS